MRFDLSIVITPSLNQCKDGTMAPSCTAGIVIQTFLPDAFAQYKEHASCQCRVANVSVVSVK